MTELIYRSLRHAKRLAVAVIGVTILIAGVVMIVLPGPAILVIPAGLGILATEFIWARNLLKKVKTRAEEIKGGNING